jgi:hypothetical protein
MRTILNRITLTEVGKYLCKFYFITCDRNLYISNIFSIGIFCLYIIYFLKINSILFLINTIFTKFDIIF